jgi:hypothetical protein
VSREETHVLFSYGTLQQCDVQLTTFGRVLDGRSGAIVGHEIDVLVVTDPAVIETSGSDRHPVRPSADPQADVPGTAFSLTDAELLAADRYEVDDYEWIRVPLRSEHRACLQGGSST